MKINTPSPISCRYESVGEAETEEIIIRIFINLYGKKASKIRPTIQRGVFNYFSAKASNEEGYKASKRRNKENQKSLPDIKKRLDSIQKASITLSNDLDWIRRNPTVGKIVLRIDPLRRNENLDSLKNASRLLADTIFPLAQNIERSLPDKNRWKEDIKPPHELIRMLAIAYTEVTGKEVAVFWEDSKENYEGEFYDLVVKIFKKMHEIEVPHNEPKVYDSPYTISGTTILRALE